MLIWTEKFYTKKNKYDKINLTLHYHIFSRGVQNELHQKNSRAKVYKHERFL